MKNYIHIVSLCLLVGCANIIPPNGGEKDMDPPRLLSVNPKNGSTNFNSSQIIFEFDEYIQLKNVNTIRISPFCGIPLKAAVNGKKLEIKIPCSLDSSTTYTINLSKCIIDLNEGNVLENFNYVFSPGKNLDSLSVSGIARELYSNKTFKNVLVGLYQNFDSLNLYYYTFTEEGGHFSIENIKNDKYVLFAITDNNSNFKNDPDELISMPDTISNFNEIRNIGLFYEEPNSSIISVKNIHRNAIQFEHRPMNDSIQILNTTGLWNKDTLFSQFWFDKSPPFIKYLFNDNEDSVKIYNTDSVKFQLSIVNNIRDLTKNNRIQIKSNVPIENLAEAGFKWNNNDLSISPFLIDPFMIEFPVQNHLIDLNCLTIDSAAITARGGLQNNALSFCFDANSSHYGSLSLKFLNFNTNMVFELFNEDHVIFKNNVSDSLKINFIKPGNYHLRIFDDLDKNYTWTSGQINPPKKPEAILIYPETITIKSNWEVELSIEL